MIASLFPHTSGGGAPTTAGLFIAAACLLLVACQVSRINERRR